MTQNLKLLRVRQVLEKTGFASRITLHRLIGKKLWTKPVHATPRTASWPEHEVDALCKARIAEQGDDEIRALVDRLHAERASLPTAN